MPDFDSILALAQTHKVMVLVLLGLAFLANNKRKAVAKLGGGLLRKLGGLFGGKSEPVTSDPREAFDLYLRLKVHLIAHGASKQILAGLDLALPCLGHIETKHLDPVADTSEQPA